VPAGTTMTTGVAHAVNVFGSDGVTPLGGGVVAIASDDPTVEKVRIRKSVLGGSRIFVVISDDNNQNATLEPTAQYTARINVLAEPDLQEGALNNDDDARATPMSSGNTLTASIATAGDRDVYSVNGINASVAAPQVLIIDVQAASSSTFQPQVTLLAADPEDETPQPCQSSCAACGDDLCLSSRMQRFITGGSRQIGFPLRDNRPVFVLINDLSDDAFQENASYTVNVRIVDDTDVGEAGDDFLITNLESAGYANEGELNEQYRRSRERARPLESGLPAVCTDDGAGAGCMSVVSVPMAIAGIEAEFQETVSCAGVPDVTMTAAGRITYEGDRDYFLIDVPSRGYWAIDLQYDLAAATPVELTYFIHSENRLMSSFLETDLQPEPSDCQSQIDCQDGHICVDGRCWRDGDSNPAFNNHTFPPVGDCSFVNVQDTRPIILEVTDNGINDFDLNTSYSIDVILRCGCPTACDDNNRCQGVPAP
jgi:hypothetical protein